jgi:hypothetical protein
MWQITGVDPNFSEEGRGTIREVEGNRADAILAGCEAAAVDGWVMVQAEGPHATFPIVGS